MENENAFEFILIKSFFALTIFCFVVLRANIQWGRSLKALGRDGNGF
jgi:hypothetical protein